MKYRKKPVVIEAIQYTGDNKKQIMDFNGAMEGPVCCIDDENGSFEIVTLEGNHIVSVGDYVIRGVKGEFYPCKPDIFHATYDAVKDNPIKNPHQFEHY